MESGSWSSWIKVGHMHHTSQASFLSRTPLNLVSRLIREGTITGLVKDIIKSSQSKQARVTNEQLQQAANSDPTLSSVRRYAHEGWPSEVAAELKAYFQSDCSP